MGELCSTAFAWNHNGIAFTLNSLYPNNATIGLATAFVMTGIWFYLAQLFKKRDKKAITFGYALLIILLIWNIIYSINIIMILIFGYLLYLVYRASKSEIIPPSVSSGV